MIMDKIPSFVINHDALLRGIYVSRKDNVGNETVTTFDIRMKEPNRNQHCIMEQYTLLNILPQHIFAMMQNGKTA